MLSWCRVPKSKLKRTVSFDLNCVPRSVCSVAPFLFANDGIDNGSLSCCEKLSMPIVWADRSLRQT